MGPTAAFRVLKLQAPVAAQHVGTPGDDETCSFLPLSGILRG